jgi:hypothetical protein
MSSRDLFARLRPHVQRQEETPRQIGGAADGAAGGVSPPLPRSMNERIRHAHDDLKMRRGSHERHSISGW